MTVPTDVGYINYGQRIISAARAWTKLLEGETYLPHPLAGLIVSETADQQDQLDVMEQAGFGVFRGDPDLPDGLKEAIITAPRFEPRGPEIMAKVGDAHQGWRGPPKRRQRMANKYVHAQEFTDRLTGWTPTLWGAHVWPDVALNDDRVRRMVRAVAAWTQDTNGTLIGGGDWNMPPSHRLRSPMRGVDLVSGQRRYGPKATFGRRCIDDLFARESDHYTVTGMSTVDLAGHERGGGEHRAVILHGAMEAR